MKRPRWDTATPPIDKTRPYRHDMAEHAEAMQERVTIYFIQAGDDGPVKIGWSRNAERRLRDLDRQMPWKLHLRRTIEAPRDYETRLHTHFREHHIRGEWFRPAPEIQAVMDGEFPADICEWPLLLRSLGKCIYCASPTGEDEPECDACFLEGRGRKARARTKDPSANPVT